MPQKTYFSLLDLLRFFAAFWVMSFHYLLGLSGELSWYRYGNLGVPLFFIISGFVISQSVQGVSLTAFAIGRWIRLFPLFWIICTLTYIFTILMPNGAPVSFGEYLVSMTMLGDKFGSLVGLPGLVDPAYWSLTVELIFYSMIGFFVYVFGWRHIRYFFWGWLFVSMFAYVFGLDQLFFFKTLLVRHASYFIFGGCLALITMHAASSITKTTKLYDYALLLITGIYATIISFRALPPYMNPHPLDGILVALLQPVFFLVVIGCVFYSSYITKDSVKKLLLILGGITYPLYLIHQTVGKTLIDYFKEEVGHTLLVIATMVLMITISYFFYLKDKTLRAFLRTHLRVKEN